jgi:hypothetical protein
MKNILAENLLRFGVKNINHVDRAVIQHLSEIAPGGSSISPEAQAQIDAMIAATMAPVTSFIKTNPITFITPGDPLTVTSATISSNKGDVNANYDLNVRLNSTFTQNPIDLSLKGVEGATLQLKIGGGNQWGAIDKMNVYKALIYTWGAAGAKAVGLDKYMIANHPTTKPLNDAGKNPLDLIVSLLNIVVNKWKSGKMATSESKIYEIAPAGGTISPDAQANMDKLVAETQGIVSKYINSSLKLDLKGGGPIAVLKAIVRGRAAGGIAVDVQWNIKNEGVYYSHSFPISSKDGVKPAGYYGLDAAAGKSSFDTQFPKFITQYFQTTGANYEACKQGIWNGILAVADKYTKSGVATKG